MCMIGISIMDPANLKFLIGIEIYDSWYNNWICILEKNKGGVWEFIFIMVKCYNLENRAWEF